ncbi:hypothetical protein GCM10022419_133120 [Nonomuraea rosea]|uniref:Uncharacterized protein n=2 Tax=Nonomuraea rosea TaxID=638574 RepID=A0ABP7A4S3_9ACTN
MMGAQLNIGEGRDGLARRVFFGNLGQLRQGYAKGMEDSWTETVWAFPSPTCGCTHSDDGRWAGCGRRPARSASASTRSSG